VGAFPHRHERPPMPTANARYPGRHPLHARRSLLDGVDLLNLRATARVVLEEVGYPLNYTVIIELAPEAGCPTNR
jgi:hypothetical protein